MTPNSLSSFFTGQYMPHGHCYMWQPHILWTNVISDLLIAAAYFSIPLAIVIFSRRRPDIGYRPVFVLFSMFILMCGITHVFGIVTIWHGIYGWHGITKAITAAVSMMTAVYLYRILPELVGITTPKQVEGIKKELYSISEEHKFLSMQVEQQRLVQFMLDTMPIGACLLDKNFDVLLSNETFREESGLSLHESESISLTELLEPDNVSNEAFMSMLSQKLRNHGQGSFKVDSIVTLRGTTKNFPAEVTIVKENFGSQSYFVVTFKNLTEIENVKRLLVESHAKLERAINATEDGVWEWVVKDNSMTWSDTFYDLIGVSELAPQHIDTWKSHIHPDHLDRVNDKFEEHFKTKEKLVVEYLGKNKKNQYGWFNLTGNTLFDVKGTPITMSGSLRYIQDSKSLEKQVIEKTELLNTIFEGANNAIWVIDVEPNSEFRFTSFNRTAAERMGIDIDEVIGLSLTELKSKFGADNIERFRDNYQSCVDIKDVKEYSECIPSKGKQHWYQTTLYPIKNDSGEVIKIVGSAIEITALKKIEQEIAENKQFLENIIDASICGICLFSFEEQKVVRINQRYTDILGYSLSEVKNLDDPISIYHPEDVLDISKHIELVIESESGSRFPIQYRMKHKDGHYVWCHTVNTIIKRDKNNNPSIMLTTFIDVTEQIELLTRLQESNSYLERFAMVASHDLQEPLRKISSFSDALSERLAEHLSKDEESKFQFERIQDAAKRMRIMISDIMGLSQINTAALHKQRITLQEAVSMACDQLQLVIEESNAKINVVKGDTELFVDRSLISQLLQNLIGNAIKFKSSNTPLIEITAQNQNNSTTIYVKDNGIGMEKRFCKQIFEPFRRLHSKDKYQGSGIGLAICKQICKVHGGTIECASDINVGTTFVIKVPKKEL
ncbi:PAS domain-containing protein [Psychrosphaera ytuae]|uniref:histidine kinase n=1 Tax=Psychrosphaera ytuae TaxID=2820710 RepID=A0A975DAH8_9GAMM|nr:PAS domain-containing protein [Psychrosphaera ytuae]QTH63562.1 PAS domain-containing protein [Psychrosphaera ytuae]